MPALLIHGLRTLLAAFAVAALLAVAAHAQSGPPTKSPFGQVTQNAPSGPATASLFDRLWVGIVEAQRDLTNAMTSAVRRLKSSGSTSAAAVLALISFVYGVLHAVGPGHGKFVISSYALASERTVRRGLLLSFMASVIQALSAIAVVGAFAVVLETTSFEIRAAEAWLQTASWGLIAALGGWLLWRQLRSLRIGPAHAAGHDGHHADEGGNHQHDASCGHMHIPDTRLLGGAWSWRQAWSLAMSVGIRPCTGAILVLVFALSIGMFWAGVLATFAMAAGTALTVSALAAIAVGSREMASRIAGRESTWGVRIEQTAGITGAALVLAMGATFFVASLVAPAPL